MTFKKGLALSITNKLATLPYLPTSYQNKGNSTCLYQKACLVVSLTEKRMHTQKRNKNARITPVSFQNSAGQRHDFHNISTWMIFKKNTVEHYFK